MALPDVNPKQTVSATHYRKLLYLLSGKVGDHQQQVALTGFDSSSQYTMVLRNRGGNSLCLQALNSAGSSAFFHLKENEVYIQNMVLPHQGTPSAPASGRVAVYAKSDNQVYFQTSAGVETVFNGASYGQNYLVNPGFEVWSRGAGAFTTDGAWTADKWQLTEGAASTTSISRTAGTDPGSEYGLAWSQSATGALSSVAQSVEKPETFRGKTVTFSMRVKTAYASAARLSLTDGVTTANSSYHTGGNTYETLSCTVAVGASITALTATLQLAIQGQAHTGEADNAVLSISTSAIPYEPLPYAEELERCRRFRQVVEVLHTGRAYDTTNTVLSASVPLTPSMSVKTTPTLTRSLAVSNLAGSDQSYTETSTALSNTSDSYGYHTLTTTWTKAGDNENVRLAGTVVAEIRA